METIDLDVKILRKLLNSKLFLNKFPIISRVFVDKSENRIDVVLSVDDTKQYFLVRNDIHFYIWNISQFAGVQTRFNIYP